MSIYDDAVHGMPANRTAVPLQIESTLFQHETPRVGKSDRKHGTPASALTRVRLLLVEDNAADVRIVRDCLEALAKPRFDLSMAHSLRDALARLNDCTPDAILLDLTLPDSYGLATVRRIHEAAPGVPIVVLTGCDSEELGWRAIQLHAQEYLVKGRMDRTLLSTTLLHAIERNRLQQQLRRSESKLRHIIDTSADGIVVLDKKGQILLVNPAAAHLLAGDKSGLLGKRITLPCASNETVTFQMPNHADVELRSSDTTWDGCPARLLSLRDVTERHQAEEARKTLVVELHRANERLQKLVNIDPLTELSNRRALEQDLVSELSRAKRFNTPLAALLLDCDDFKRINDQLGHAAGDTVLLEIARRIRAAIRTTDHVARVGGDEFMLLMPETNLWEAMRFGERVRLAISSTPVLSTPQPVTVTVSTGACKVPYSSSSVEELLALTRIALKRSKDLGKNCVSASGRVGRPSVQSDERVRIVEKLCKQDAFSVVAQEIVRIDNECVAGYELLSRSRVDGFEQPSDFFRVCLENNILTLVDLACLKAGMASVHRLDSKATVHVNLFPSTILNTPPEALLKLFTEAAGERVFCLEISEQQFIYDPRELRRRLDALREGGVLIALDDVGFGRTSLELLILLEPNIVKIDGDFVRNAARSRNQQAAFLRLVGVIETLKADLVAEGIENHEHLDIVRESGVTFGQGFIWGRPRSHQSENAVRQT